MHIAELESETDFDGWRREARHCLSEGLSPENITWSVGNTQPNLFGGAPSSASTRTPVSKLLVSRAFIDDARLTICHRDPGRFDLLYRLLWRLQADARLMQNAVDDDVSRMHQLVKAIRRDRHKMRAFVRFRAVKDAENTFVAWFEPDHRIVEENASFFVRRFANMNWSILTPERSAHWDGEALRFGAGARREDAPTDDALEDLWKTYFKSIFNPARLKVKAMTSEMPKKYWKNLPEAELIAPMIASAQRDTARMLNANPTPVRREATYDWQPDETPATPLSAVKRDAASCARCELHCHATQTVFGDGPTDTKVMLVGEQPGDREDLAGRPFVGPAGQVLDKALLDAGIDRTSVYLTNAVKHFRFTLRGKRRIHQAPNVSHIEACRWWLAAERRIVKPQITLALGATAVRALAGRAMTVEEAADGFQCFDGDFAMATLHPAAILRQPSKSAQEAAYSRLVSSLRRVMEPTGLDA